MLRIHQINEAVRNGYDVITTAQGLFVKVILTGKHHISIVFIYDRFVGQVLTFLVKVLGTGAKVDEVEFGLLQALVISFLIFPFIFPALGLLHILTYKAGALHIVRVVLAEQYVVQLDIQVEVSQLVELLDLFDHLYTDLQDVYLPHPFFKSVEYFVHGVTELPNDNEFLFFLKYALRVVFLSIAVVDKLGEAFDLGFFEILEDLELIQVRLMDEPEVGHIKNLQRKLDALVSDLSAVINCTT